jgi:uncharacterized repeat protein (TIGR04052 family)
MLNHIPIRARRPRAPSRLPRGVLVAALSTIALLTGSACKSSVAIHFAAKVGDKTFRCGQSYPDLGTTKSTFTPSDLRFYISEVRLLRADGQEVPLELDQDGKWQAKDVALLDFEDKTSLCFNGTPDTNDTIHGRVPSGDYQGIRFTLGVPFALNHNDNTLAPSPLNLSTMFWGWNGGYKFLRIDAKTTGLPGIEIHLGSTGCTPQEGRVTACARPNRADIRLTGFDPRSKTLVADLARLLADVDLDHNQADTAPLCMASGTDADCGGIFKRLGLRLTDGTPDPGGQQTFFRVE